MVVMYVHCCKDRQEVHLGVHQGVHQEVSMVVLCVRCCKDRQEGDVHHPTEDRSSKVPVTQVPLEVPVPKVPHKAQEDPLTKDPPKVT
jgi:hypothetical protein